MCGVFCIEVIFNFLCTLFSAIYFLSAASINKQQIKSLLFGEPEYSAACCEDDGFELFVACHILSEHKYLGSLLQGFLFF